MRLKVTSGPAVEPVTRDEIKQHQSIADTLSDDVIDDLLLAARQYAESYTQSKLITQTVVAACDQFPTGEDVLDLGVHPVQSITSVTDDGVAVDSGVYALDDFDKADKLQLQSGQVWPTGTASRNRVQVTMVVGFGDTAADVPDPIKQAIRLAVGHWLNYQALAEQGISVQMVPRAVDHLLNPYKRVAV